MDFEVRTIDELELVAQQFLNAFPSPQLFLLRGEMGAGKTTFVKVICEALNATGSASPTFSLVNEYVSDSGEKFFHLDLYRVSSVQEALDFGIEEYLDQKTYIFIEWPELIESLLDKNTPEIKISDHNGVRHISF